MNGMRACSAILTMLLTALSGAAAARPGPLPAPAANERVLYRGATLIDGRGGPALANMAVLVRGERIEQVAPDRAMSPAIVAGARVIDLHGHYLMPGLIDAHVHLATPPNRRQAEALLRRDIYGGVTAVRDMADDLRSVGELTRASLAGEIAAPNIYYAALMAGPAFFTDPRTFQVSAGGTPGYVPWMQAITDQTNLPLTVAEARGTYATAIKLYADLTARQAAQITEEAHRQHLLVWAHATLYPAKPSEVVAAGVDAISHACLLVREGSDRLPPWNESRNPAVLDTFKDGRNPALARLFDAMQRRGTILDATIWTYGPIAAISTSSPSLAPKSCDDTVGGAITGQAWRAGVDIAAGTDAVAPWTDQWPDLFHEIDALVSRAGMTPAAAIRSATLVGARAAGQARDMGSIEPGKLANMVVLAKDPTTDIANLKTVVTTIKRGRAYERRQFIPLIAADIVDF